MKIAYCSDLHLEFGDLEIYNQDWADVLVLAGDILVERDLDMYDRRQIEQGAMKERSVKLHAFFDRVCRWFPHVVYVMGNHEHYDGDFARTGNELKRKLAHHTNLHILDREVFHLNDVTFIGGTLWTDMNRRDSITLLHMKDMMNDFHCIENSNTPVHYRVPVQAEDGVVKQEFKTRPGKFTPETAADEHDLMLGFIKSVVAGHQNRKFVMVGHHSPSKLSTHPKYQHNVIMNGGYSSDLSEFILDHPQIKVWAHGHTHHPFDYIIGETRVVCNPRGYWNYEEQAQNFELRYVEV